MHPALAAVVTFILIGTRLTYAAPPDALVVVGAGQAGNWTTNVVFAGAALTPHTYQIGEDADYAGTTCPGPCPFADVFVGPNESTKLRFSDSSLQSDLVTTYYVVPDDSQTLPAVTSQQINLVTGQVVQIPIFRLSTLLGLDTSHLVFPGAQRSPSGRSDILLTSLRAPGRTQADTATVRIDALDAAGVAIGSEEILLAYGRSVFLIDELARLGVGQLALGQLRVTRVGGTGAIWGVMASIADDGAVTLCVGANP